MGCFSRSSDMSDGSRKQPMQARLNATGKGAPPSLATGGTRSLAADWAAAALAASLSALSTVSASRTSLVPAPRSGCCARSLASSGFWPRSGSATRRARTASRRPSVHVVHEKAVDMPSRATDSKVSLPEELRRNTIRLENALYEVLGRSWDCALMRRTGLQTAVLALYVVAPNRLS
eukprot:scaffold13784_cov68-Phaeocystis_antarctica.AAC.1